ncbi:30S ribosomal protein S1 [Mariniblastus fucicola]|uniref:30S ribosomal protein S1 n=1 Tax=Mariniblastus fucicola TaxID=980251 RepID=A0A5B9P418_9BACT|nr:S1 RNA-binding domain-containing protein [Mariniblastus fucicola]QEG20964.1 30S ribosomal protein S1 [Mariniblastus fucicola]
MTEPNTDPAADTPQESTEASAAPAQANVIPDTTPESAAPAATTDTPTPDAGTAPSVESPAAESPTAEAQPAEPATPAKPKIQIGSQRDVAKGPIKPAAVQAALANPVSLDGPEAAEVVDVAPAIKSDAGLSDNIDDDIDAALAGLSMEAVLDSTEAATEELELNSRVKGLVTKIHRENDNVFFKLNGQFEGVAAFHHFKEEPKEGDLIEIIVRGRNAEDGLYELSVPGAVVGVADWDDIQEGTVVEAVVTGSNTGGLEVKINSLSGFMPMSQIDRFRVEDVSGYINQKLQCVVMEVNPAKRKLVVSRRAILDRENEEKRAALMEELEAGQLRDGTVTKLMDFGAFVDLGGAEGLIHVSKVSWTRVKHPSEVLEVGQKVRVKVEKIGDGRISLSHRDTLEHPWKTIAEQFSVDDVVKGKVTKVMDFGAFVQLAPGVEGLVHISELAHHRVTRVSSICNAGDEIDVKILSMDTENQKMSLSHKATLAAPAAKSDGKKDEPELPDSRELVVPSTGKPLKGGTNNPSGGEQFGLKW